MCVIRCVIAVFSQCSLLTVISSDLQQLLNCTVQEKRRDLKMNILKIKRALFDSCTELMNREIFQSIRQHVAYHKELMIVKTTENVSN